MDRRTRGRAVNGEALRAVSRRMAAGSCLWPSSVTVLSDCQDQPGLNPYRSGSANTHNVEPPSGFFISGTSVDNERPSPDPLPVATATYCLPLTL
jgi:hypothetical protein